MKTKINFLSVLFNVAISMFVGSAVSFAAPEFSAKAVGSAVFALGTIPQLIGNHIPSIGGGFAFMGLQTEVWIADIQEQLFANNEFLNLCTDHSGYVINKTVHVPQSGSQASVVKNRSSLPASIAQRTDTDLNYDLNDFTTDPVLITDLDEIQTSYDKRQSVMGQKFALLADRVAKDVLFSWAVTGSKVIRTTGATTALLPNSTATGTRKCLTKADVALLATRMDQDNVPADGRYLMLDSVMFNDLFTVSEIMSNQYMNGSASQPDGTIATLFGFKIMKRSNVVKYTSAGGNVLVPVGTSDATTDCAGSIAWSKYSVAKALGDVKVFAHENAPEYYGSVFSAQILAVGKILRADNAGVWAIAQGV